MFEAKHLDKFRTKASISVEVSIVDSISLQKLSYEFNEQSCKLRKQKQKPENDCEHGWCNPMIYSPQARIRLACKLYMEFGEHEQKQIMWMESTN